MHLAACLRLVSPLEIQQQQEQQQQHEKVPDGHGRSFGTWPWQKYQLNLLVRIFKQIYQAKVKVQNINFYNSPMHG